MSDSHSTLEFFSMPHFSLQCCVSSGLPNYRYKRRLHALWSLLNGDAEIHMLREKVLQGMCCDINIAIKAAKLATVSCA